MLKALGIGDDLAHTSIRFGLGRINTEEEVDYVADRVIEAVPPIVAQLRKLSPYWSGNGPVENPEAAFAPAYA